MKLTTVILSHWFSTRRMNVEEFQKVLENDFKISTMKFFIEDLAYDKTGKVVKNILSANPKLFVCLDVDKKSVEFLVKQTHIPIICVNTVGEANALGKAVIAAVSAIREKVYAEAGGL